MLKPVYRILASLKLAVILIVVLAGVLAWATILEAKQGREYAQWYVYGSLWFLGLLAALGFNILAAALIRFPWTRSQTGFVVTHAGLLVLLVGAVQTFVGGIDGQISLQEGQQTDKILVTNRSLITALRQKPTGSVATEFSFHPGPVDWAEGRQLDFGNTDAFGLKILKFYRYCRERTDWVEDPTQFEGPVLKLCLYGPDFRPVSQEWLTANTFGGEAVIGPTHYDLWPVPVASMLKDFLEPPTENLGESGILSMHYEGRMERFRVDDWLGKTIPLGETGLAVEIVNYLPNAKPTAGGTFESRGNQPKNPLLEFRIHLADSDQPRRQIAFAKLPLLNLDGVHGSEFPVKFWYHHPQVTPIAGAAFLQTPDGTLYCRPSSAGAYQAARQVQQGDRIALGDEFSVLVQQHLPHARREVSFTPVELAPGETGKGEAAALVEVTTSSQSRRVWLKRHDEKYGYQRIFTDQGPVVLSFGYDHLPLGFQLQLHEFTRRMNPGHVGDAAFASAVRISDAAGAIDESHEITMNEPLVYGKFTLYQSSFREQPDGADVSVLTAAYDPGRFLKYLGSLMICGGIAVMFFMRSYMFKKVPILAFGSRKRAAVPSERSGDCSAASQDIAGAA